MKEKIKNNLNYIIFVMVMILLNYMFMGSAIAAAFHKSLSILCMNLIIIMIEIGFVILIHNKLTKWKIESTFLLISIILGIGYMIVFPVAGTPDELAHFYRAYEVSSFHVTSEYKDSYGGRELPASLIKIFEDQDIFNIKYKDELGALRIKLNKNEKTFIEFSSSALYSPICYLPQSIGIGIGRILNLPPTIIFYLGRITNFICFIIMMYFAIKYIPIRKTTTLVLATLPIVFQAAISLSPDALTIATAFSLVSFTLYMKYEKKKLLDQKDYVIMILLSILMSMLKIVYIPICFVLLLIPKEKFKSTKDKYMKLTLLFIFIIILNLGWLAYSSRFLIETNPGVNSKEQIQFILTSPIAYCKVLFNTISNYYHLYLITGLGGSLGWLRIVLNEFYVFLYFMMIVFMTITEQSSKKLKQIEKCWIGILIIGVILLIFTSLYVQWNPVMQEMILGVQGRYFIPIALLAVLLVENKVKYQLDNQLKYILTFIAFFNIYATVVCFCYHLV